MYGTELRLNRLFGNGRNAVIVAGDHGEFDGPIPGLEKLPEALSAITDDVDGVLLSPGMLRHCWRLFARRGAPLAIVMLNWGTTYCFKWDYREAVTVPVISPLDAIAEGADIVLVSPTLKTGDETADGENVRCFTQLCWEAKGLGIPVLGEAFPPTPHRLSPEELHDWVLITTRIIAEVGADFVKTYYTRRFREVAESCPVPILVLGAERLPREIDALRLASDAVKDGARGVVFGRNVLQSSNPSAFASALCEVVREGAKPEQSAKKHGFRT